MCEPSEELRRTWSRVASAIMLGPKGWLGVGPVHLKELLHFPASIPDIDVTALRLQAHDASLGKGGTVLASIQVGLRDVTQGGLKLKESEIKFRQQLLLQFTPRLNEVKCKLMARLGKSVEGEMSPAFMLRDSFLSHLAVVCRMLCKHAPAREMVVLRCTFGAYVAKGVHNHHGSCCLRHEHHTGHYNSAPLIRGCYRPKLAMIKGLIGVA
eukprot:3625667-Amphidinium_carterae.5